MSGQVIELTVRKSVLVEASQQRAFDVFTAGFTSWWPLDTHHIGEKDAVAAVMEPRAGGRWFERAGDGTECEWGTVIAFEPPHRVLLGWQLNADWKHDPAITSEVEVRFIPEGAASTRVELEHRGLSAYGDRAAAVHEAVSSPGGWSGLLERFAAAARG